MKQREPEPHPYGGRRVRNARGPAQYIFGASRLAAHEESEAEVHRQGLLIEEIRASRAYRLATTLRSIGRRGR